MTTDIIQKALVRNEQGHILLLKRSNTDKRRPLEWDLPGGRLDDGESFLQGIKREIKEESDIDATDVSLVYSKTTYQQWQQNESNVVRLFYIANVHDQNVTISDEHTEFKWVSIQNALEFIDYDIQKEFIQYIIEKQLV